MAKQSKSSSSSTRRSSKGENSNHSHSNSQRRDSQSSSSQNNTGLLLPKFLSYLRRFHHRNSSNSKSKSHKSDKESHAQKLVYSVILPIIIVFALFNLIISGEAVENLYRALNGRKHKSYLEGQVQGLESNFLNDQSAQPGGLGPGPQNGPRPIGFQSATINITEALLNAAKAATAAAQREQQEEDERARLNPTKGPPNHQQSQHLIEMVNKLNNLLSSNTQPSLKDLQELSSELQAAHSQSINAASGELYNAVKSEQNPNPSLAPGLVSSVSSSFFTSSAGSVNDQSQSISSSSSSVQQQQVPSQEINSNFQLPNQAYNPELLGADQQQQPLTSNALQTQHCINTIIDWEEKEENKLPTPKYFLNPNKVLIPALYQGPNNQIFGFRESMIMAIKLNRTLIIPPFFPFVANDAVDFGHSVDGSKRINLEELRKFMSVQPLSFIDSPANQNENGNKICGEVESNLDFYFQTRVAQCTAPFFERLQTFQFHIKRKLLRFENIGDVKSAAGASEDCSLLKSEFTQPKSSQFMDKKQPVALNFDSAQINQIFSANSHPSTNCAALILPYKSFPLGDFINLNKADKMASLNVGQDEINLVKDVVSATPRPLFIQELAARFIDEVMRSGSDFVGIHWAYDKRDWFGYSCNNIGTSQFMKTKCEEISTAHEQPHLLSTGIAKLMRFLEQKGAVKSRSVYIASRPIDEEYFNQVSDWLAHNTPVKIFTMTQVKEYFRKYDDCGYTRNDSIEEIISLIEQEIVYRSNIFVRSVVSSWSLNVQLQRAVERRDKEDVTGFGG